ncbi:MAG: ParB/RepB/Spo0J family partition protein [Sphingomonadales bacterium]|nr:ParB/RepB/Spo0J family partition protein [Sphingomonadales bacterium]MBK9269941.1 ParB/RepB/Spo0J family partition protein [Sphingomonadales bacterium]
MIQMIPLNKLSLSPNNVRKTDTDQLIAEFADNIETRGILQNLVAVPSGKGYDVIVGGRRLRALNLLKDRKAIKANHPVPVAVMEAASEEQAEISLIENVIRQQMTVADEIRAYKFFINEGSDLDAIAKRFGRTRRAVEGRLRLADLAEPIFAALERNEITLDVAKAYATTSNHDRQTLVWDQVHDSWQGNNADAIRRMITTSSINSTSPIAKLVTEEAYLAAGGRIERDLFTTDETANWIDPEIANKIAAEKIEAAAAAMAEETGLAWVRPVLDKRVSHSATEDLHYYHLPPAALSDEEQAEADALLEQVRAIEAEFETVDDEDETALEDLNERWDQTTEKHRALTNKPGHIPDDMKSLVGAFVILDDDGNPVLDTSRYTERPVQTKRGASGASGTSATGEGDTAADTGIKPLSEKLIAELAIQRRDVLSLHLANSPAVAMDYMIFAIADRGITYGVQSHGSTIAAPYPQTYCQTYPESPAYTAMADVKENLESGWTEHATTVERFDAFCLLTDDEKAAWLAFCVARSVQPSIGVSRRSGHNGPELNPLHDRIAELLEIDVAREWRPTATNYFDRVSKATILAHVDEIGGKTMATSYASSKKADLSATAEKIFSGSTIVDAEVKEAALAWVPEHMRFNTAAKAEEASSEIPATDEPDNEPETPGDAETDAALDPETVEA